MIFLARNFSYLSIVKKIRDSCLAQLVEHTTRPQSRKIKPRIGQRAYFKKKKKLYTFFTFFTLICGI